MIDGKNLFYIMGLLKNGYKAYKDFGVSRIILEYAQERKNGLYTIMANSYRGKIHFFRKPLIVSDYLTKDWKMMDKNGVLMNINEEDFLKLVVQNTLEELISKTGKEKYQVLLDELLGKVPAIVEEKVSQANEEKTPEKKKKSPRKKKSELLKTEIGLPF